MTFATSEKRLTRSQAHAESSVISSKTPIGGSTPSSAQQSACGFSKAGRRVLAELACNDSPVVGLLPAGTPKDKSSDGGCIRSRHALLADVLTYPACTPLGESLLRSQVQLLLQKVESDMSAHHPKNAPPLHMSANPSVGNVAVASPIMLVAPTPLNTPASVAVPQMPQPHSQCSIALNSVCSSADKTMHDVEVPPPSTADKSGKHPDLHHELNLKGETTSAETLCLPESGSTTLCTEMQPPLLLEISDAPSSSEIFLGKRVLHFDEDTPSYKASQEKLSSKVVFNEEAGHNTPAMRQLDDDEASEWSVNVNVGSPADQLCLVEGTTTGDTSSPSYVKAMVHEHVKMMQQLSSSKVHLLWDDNMERNAIEDRRGDIDQLCEEGEDEADYEHDKDGVGDEEEYSEDYYCEGEDEEVYDGEECEELCDMLREMRVEEESKALPRGEGKHTRFLYGNGNDEIVEAIVVRGEEDVSHKSAAVRLKGLPVPLGRHWRFAQDEDENDEDIAS